MNTKQSDNSHLNKPVEAQSNNATNETGEVIVSAHHHDKQCDNVDFVRIAGTDASRTAELLKQCGYQVDIYPKPLSGGGNDDARLCAAPRGATIKRTVISPSPAQNLYLSRSEQPITADPKPKPILEALLNASESLEDIGGNEISDRIEANEDWYDHGRNDFDRGDLRDEGRNPDGSGESYASRNI